MTSNNARTGAPAAEKKVFCYKKDRTWIPLPSNSEKFSFKRWMLLPLEGKKTDFFLKKKNLAPGFRIILRSFSLFLNDLGPRDMLVCKKAEIFLGKNLIYSRERLKIYENANLSTRLSSVLCFAISDIEISEISENFENYRNFRNTEKFAIFQYLPIPN